jgi:hypothetical protein
MKTSCPKEMSQKENRQGIKFVMRDLRPKVTRNPIRWKKENVLLRRKEVMT